MDSVVLITGALTGIGRATAIGFRADDGCSRRRIVAGNVNRPARRSQMNYVALARSRIYPRADVRQDEAVGGDLVEAARSHALVALGRGWSTCAGHRGHRRVPSWSRPVKATPQHSTPMFWATILGMKHAMQADAAARAGQRRQRLLDDGPQGRAWRVDVHRQQARGGGRADEVGGAGGCCLRVRVNAVAPGPVETGMLLNRFTGSEARKAGLIAGVPMQRAGRPEEIAQAIVFLASDKAVLYHRTDPCRSTAASRRADPTCSGSIVA